MQNNLCTIESAAWLVVNKCWKCNGFPWTITSSVCLNSRTKRTREASKSVLLFFFNLTRLLIEKIKHWNLQYYNPIKKLNYWLFKLLLRLTVVFFVLKRHFNDKVKYHSVAYNTEVKNAFDMHCGLVQRWLASPIHPQAAEEPKSHIECKMSDNLLFKFTEID